MFRNNVAHPSVDDSEIKIVLDGDTIPRLNRNESKKLDLHLQNTSIIS